MKFLILTFLLGLLVFSGCTNDPCGNNKDEFISNFKAFTKKVDAANLPSSDSKWSSYDETFKQSVEDCFPMYESDMSRKERRKFWGMALGYYYQRLGAASIEELFSKSDKADKNLQRTLKEFKESELKDVLNSVGKDVQRWKAKLQEMTD